MEEWCDGIAPNSFVEADPQVKPDFVVIGEPTKMQIYRGHKGRIELKITAHGRSAHAASHYLGDNAVYKMMSIITAIRELDRRFRFGMGYHPIQGYPSIAVTDVSARTASLNAVPDQFTIYLDRRITLNEPRDEVINQIKGLIPDYLQEEIFVEELLYDTPSYTGFVFLVSKFYPPWLLEDEHPLAQAGQRTVEMLWGEKRPLGTWDFSTNGTQRRARELLAGHGRPDGSRAHHGQLGHLLPKSVNVTMGTNPAYSTAVATQLAASAHFDGTSAAKTVNLNFGLGVNTEIDANAAIGVTGSITIVWAHL